MSNYPDDIRSYDHHPSSPFYEEWKCPICGSNENDSDCILGECTVEEMTYDPRDLEDDGF